MGLSGKSVFLPQPNLYISYHIDKFLAPANIKLYIIASCDVNHLLRKKPVSQQK